MIIFLLNQWMNLLSNQTHNVNKLFDLQNSSIDTSSYIINLRNFSCFSRLTFTIISLLKLIENNVLTCSGFYMNCKDLIMEHWPGK